MAVHEKLKEIQTMLKAPKNLYNKYGGFNYRNAEGIYEAVKPLLNKLDMTLIISDSIQTVGAKNYVQATACLTDCETGEQLSSCALARETEAKKGMDDSQITGTASSYARKYALNGLFLLDDTKDEDSYECREYKENKSKAESAESTQPAAFKPATAQQIHKINEYIMAYAGMCEDASEGDIWNTLKKKYGFAKQSDISKELAERITKQVEAWYKKKKEA
ncbi:ERF family protein [Agathobacter rectalis]|uniref:ERF family protein n=1 Tax=Agathobacter rectalis TaxID=39491 RepID=UPI000D658979|nr:ERF family protein [Agathobacter rectalis]